jgi:gas vesicle protein
MTHDADSPEHHTDATRLRAWLTSFGCGAIVGFALGIAFAPSRGRDTRRAVAAATRRGRERTSKLIERGRRAAGRQHARMDGLVHTAGDRMRGIADDVAKRGEAMKSAFESGRREASR